MADPLLENGQNLYGPQLHLGTAFKPNVWYSNLGGVFLGYEPNGRIRIGKRDGTTDTINFQPEQQKSGFAVGGAPQIYNSAQPFDPNITPVREGDPASLWQQMLAARQDRPGGRPTAERYQFSHGGSWDATNTFGPTWGKGSNYDNYPLPAQQPPVPPGPVGNAPPPGTNTPGLLGGGSAPVNGQAPLNRNTGTFPAPRGEQTPIGQQPSLRQPAGLLGAQMVGSQADATVSRGLIGDKMAPASAPGGGAAAWPTGGMAPTAGGATDAFRFSGGSPAEQNYNALAQISPALAGKYYAAAAGSQPGLSTAALNQTGGGEAYHGLQSFYGSGGGMGYSGGRVLEAGGPSYLTATLANLSPSQRAAATAALKAQGLLSDTAQFQTMLTPQQAAAWGLTAAKLPPGMNPAGTGGMGLYTVPLAK